MKPQILLIFAFVLISVLSFGVMAVGTSPATTNDMILRLQFDNSSSVGENYWTNTKVFDYSSRKNNGSGSSFVRYNSTGDYLGLGSATFNGTARIDSFNVTGKLNISETRTIAFWIKPLQNNSFQAITGFQYERNAVYIDTGGNRFRYSLFNNTGTPYRIYSANNSVQLNNWTFVTATWDKTAGTMSLYINGYLSSSLSGILPAYTPYEPSTLFKVGDNANDQFLNASLGDLILYNRSLSALEVNTLFNTYYGCYNYSDNLSMHIMGNTNISFCSANYNTNNFNLNAPLWTSFNVSNFLEGNNIYIDGLGSNITNIFPNTQIFYVDHSSNISIKNLNILSSDNQSIAFRFSRTSNISFQNINLKGLLVGWAMEIVNPGEISLNNSWTFKDIIVNLTQNLSGAFDKSYDGGSNLYFDNFSVYSDLDIYQDTFGIKISNVSNVVINNSFFSLKSWDYPHESFAITWNYGSNLQILNTKFIDGCNRLVFDAFLYPTQNILIQNSNFSNSNCMQWIKTQYYVNNITLINDTFNDFDEAFWFYLTSNITLKHLRFNNAITSYDGYNDAFELGRGSSNVYLEDINMTNMGTACITLRGVTNLLVNSSSGINCNTVNPSFYGHPYGTTDAYSHSYNPRNLSTYNEAPTGIIISPFYEKYTGDSTEQRFADFRTSSWLQNYTSYNINLGTPTFGNNVNLFLKNMNGQNVSVILPSNWYRKYSIDYLMNFTEFFINNNFNNLSNWNYAGIPSIMMDENFYDDRVINFSFVKNSYSYFRNTRNLDRYNNVNNSMLNNIYQLGNFNLSSPLLAFSNRSSIYQSGTNLEFNLTLKPNEWVYVLENFNCSESLQNLNGFPCGRENSPFNLSYQISGTTKSYTLMTSSNDSLSFPVELITQCSNIKQVTVNGASTPYVCSNDSVIFNITGLSNLNNALINLNSYLPSLNPLCINVISNYGDFFVAVIIIFALISTGIIILFLFVVVKGIDGEYDSGIMKELNSKFNLKLVMLAVLGITLIVWISLVIFGNLCS